MQRPHALLVATLALGCNAILGVQDFSAGGSADAPVVDAPAGSGGFAGRDASAGSGGRLPDAAPPDVAPSMCVPIAQICDPVCNTGCPSGQRCDIGGVGQGVCITTSGETQNTGQSCTASQTTDTCVAQDSCLTDGVTSMCFRLCYADSDCASTSACCDISIGDGNGNSIGFQACGMPSSCDPTSTSGGGCPSGNACYPLPCASHPDNVECGTAGSSVGACTYVNDCASGYTCVGQTPTCQRTCRLAAPNCPNGTTCTPIEVGSNPPIDTTVYGVCIPVAPPPDAGVDAAPIDAAPPDAAPTADAPPSCATDSDCGSSYVCCDGACASICTLVDGQWNVQAMAVDSTSVYWTTISTTANCTGSVLKCGITGCGGTPTSLATSTQGAPSGVAVDSTSVYWVTQPTPGPPCPPLTVAKCATGGCGNAPTVLVSGQGGSNDIALDQTSVYWPDGNNGSISKCAIGGCGGTPTVIASGQTGAWGIAVDATSVYWTIYGYPSTGSLLSCPLAGCTGAPTTLATALLQPMYVRSDSTFAYWTNYDLNNGGSIMRCAVSDCSNTRVTLVSGQGSPSSLAIDTGSIFWTHGGTLSSPSGVSECPKTGCVGPPVSLASLSNYPAAIALDATSVYWFSGNGSNGGSIQRTRKR
jgi:hypothetical protein